MDRSVSFDGNFSKISVAFINMWIFRFGVSLHVITDRSSQFKVKLFSELSRKIGFHRMRMTSYQPQTNGLIEHTHCTIKTAIIAKKESWLSALSIFLLRITPNESN